MLFLPHYVLFSSLTSQLISSDDWLSHLISRLLRSGKNPHRAIISDFPIFFPQVSVRNVYIFPGIPSLMEKAFKGLEHLFAGSGTTFHSREVTPCFKIHRKVVCIGELLKAVVVVRYL